MQPITNNQSTNNTIMKQISKDELFAKIVKALKPLNPVKIIVFGSYAYGKPNENSDIDLLIEFKDFKSANLRNYMGFIKEIQQTFKRKADVATNEMIKPLLWKYIKRDLIEG